MGGGRKDCVIYFFYVTGSLKNKCPPPVYHFPPFSKQKWFQKSQRHFHLLPFSCLLLPPCIIPLSLPFVCSPEVEKQSGFINSVCLKLCYKKQHSIIVKTQPAAFTFFFFLTPALSKQLVFSVFLCSSLSLLLRKRRTVVRRLVQVTLHR